MIILKPNTESLPGPVVIKARRFWCRTPDGLVQLAADFNNRPGFMSIERRSAAIRRGGYL